MPYEAVTKLSKHLPKSPTFFGAVAQMSPSEYLKVTHERTYQLHLSDLSSQCYANSKILTAKFAKLRQAYQLFLWGIIIMIPAGIIMRVRF